MGKGGGGNVWTSHCDKEKSYGGDFSPTTSSRKKGEGKENMTLSGGKREKACGEKEKTQPGPTSAILEGRGEKKPHSFMVRNMGRGKRKNGKEGEESQKA